MDYERVLMETDILAYIKNQVNEGEK